MFKKVIKFLGDDNGIGDILVDTYLYKEANKSTNTTIEESYDDIWKFKSMATPGFQELFESRIKNYFYLRHDLYAATRVKTIPFPPSHEDVHFKYSFVFKKRSRKIVDCYTTYAFN